MIARTKKEDEAEIRSAQGEHADMSIRTLTGADAQSEMGRILSESRARITSTLAGFEPESTFNVWFTTLRGIEELINLAGELEDEAILDRILDLNLLNPATLARDLPIFHAGLMKQFTRDVSTRLVETLLQLHAVAASFVQHQIPTGLHLARVKSAIGYLQSRRRHLLALLHTIPGTCRGSKKLQGLDGLNQFLYVIETDGLTTTNMHQNLMLALVYQDFTLRVDSVGVLASHGFNALDPLFLEPERTAIVEMTDVDFSSYTSVPVSNSVIFSKAELENNLNLIAAAYAEFHLENTSYGTLAAFVRSLLPVVADEYFVRLPVDRFDALCAAAGLPQPLKKALVVPGADFVNNTSTYAPFTRVGGQMVTSVTLLSRFANHWKNVCLNRVRRYQIRSGFIFEGSVKTALREQGFTVTDIKRIGHAEFDVVATLNDVIYNVQCKNNLVDLNRIEADVKRFVRYNRTLDRAYQKALNKERARESVLRGALGLSAIKHFVVSRFPVATQNPNVLAFGEIHRFKSVAMLA